MKKCILTIRFTETNTELIKMSGGDDTPVKKFEKALETPGTGALT